MRTLMFSIDYDWLSSLHEEPEVRQTSAAIRIMLGTSVLTRNVDDWSKTVSDEVRLSAYPLALWFASNWWRLRWEPLPSGPPDVSWRMSHELAAAGYGYVWPRILFVSDGASIEAWAEPAAESPAAPVTYLTRAHGLIPAWDFERAIEDFIDGVLARLDQVGLSSTALHALWQELSDERADQALSSYRRLEAIAGFDPDEGADDILDRLWALVRQGGERATQEIAALCVADQSERVLGDVDRLVQGSGLDAAPDRDAMFQQIVAQRDLRQPPWEQGREMARLLRTRLELNGQSISNEDLCGVLGMGKEDALDPRRGGPASLGLAVRRDSRYLTLHPRSRLVADRRFELARFLCDHITAGPDDRWLPVTSAKTWRQKVQRAFAAEFLCPIADLTAYLDGDYSEEALDDAAQHFNVRVRAVESQLVNNRLLPREFLPDVGANTLFPYGIAA